MSVEPGNIIQSLRNGTGICTDPNDAAIIAGEIEQLCNDLLIMERKLAEAHLRHDQVRRDALEYSARLLDDMASDYLVENDQRRDKYWQALQNAAIEIRLQLSNARGI